MSNHTNVVARVLQLYEPEREKPLGSSTLGAYVRRGVAVGACRVTLRYPYSRGPGRHSDVSCLTRRVGGTLVNRAAHGARSR
jgi:hypothetical protein